MKTRKALVAMTEEARRWLTTWAKDFTEEEARTTAGTQTNPLAWQLAHVAVAQDDVYRIFTGKSGAVSDELRSQFGLGGAAPTSAASLPALEELWPLLDKTQKRLLKLVKGSKGKDFDQPPPEKHPFYKSLGQSIFSIALHENYHVGQIAILRKALGKPRVA